MTRKLLLTAAVIMTLQAARAQARTFHVAPNGADTNSGIPEAPLRTLQRAADLARAGDTVLVHSGVYQGGVVLRFSGWPDKPIVFKNAPGHRPVVDGQGRGRIELQSRDGWRRPIGWIIVEGFEVTNGWDGIKFYNAHHGILKGNRIHHNLNQGILGNGHHVRIEGNVIAHNGLRPDNPRSNLEHGIYVTGTDIQVVNNVIYGNRAYGIQVAGYPFQPDNHAGPEFATARRWLISHNTIAFQQNRAAIVLWQPDTTDCLIQNNICYRNALTLGRGDCQGIDLVACGTGHQIQHNLFFGPGRTSLGKLPAGCLAADNLDGKDPLFIDPEQFEFRLRQGSPAIDAGHAHPAVLVDFDGQARSLGGAPDLGAFEWRKPGPPQQ